MRISERTIPAMQRYISQGFESWNVEKDGLYRVATIIDTVSVSWTAIGEGGTREDRVHFAHEAYAGPPV